MSKKKKKKSPKLPEVTENSKAVSVEEPAPEAVEEAPEEAANNSEQTEQTLPEKTVRRKKINTRSLKRGTLSVVFTVVFIAAVVIVNVIVGVLSERLDTAADLTGGGLYTLDETTERFLQNRLNTNVTVTVLDSEQSFVQNRNNKQVSEILRKMSMASECVSVDYINLDQNPNYTSRFKGETLDSDYIVVECEKTGRHRIITPTDYFGLTSEEAMYYYYYYDYVTEYQTEQEVVSAMLYVTDEAPVRIAFTEGFGETDSYALKNLLEKNGYELESINLLTAAEIDPDIDFVVVHSPRIDLDNTQLAKLDKFLDNNGEYGKSVFYFASVTQPKTPNIDGFLSDWGISVGFSDIGQSEDKYRISSLTMFAHLQQICYTDFTSGTYGSSLYTLGADLRPVYELSNSDADTKVLMKTFDGAFLYPLDSTDSEKFDVESAEHGEFNDVVAATKYSSDGTPSRVFVFGSDQLASSYLMAYSNANNGEFFINLFDSVSGKEAGISITPKSAYDIYFEMDTKTANTLAVMLCIVIPVCVIVLGIAVWLRRRHR